MTPPPSRDDYLDSFLESAFGSDSEDSAVSLETPSDDENESTPPEILARYPVADLLGRGGVGLVYRAHDAELGRDVAIKILSRKFAKDGGAVARFEDEARIASRLQHPGIVPIHEIGRLADGRPYFTMKIVAGETLADRLRAKRTAASLRPLLEILERVAETLAFAHSHGVVHGDVKPQNVMVGAFGEVQVMDWGFARDYEGADDAADAARSGRVAGTPSYMSPEQARGDAAVIGPRSDVFGLGAILCEILTGTPPYDGESRSEILLRAAKGWQDAARARLTACEADPSLIALALSSLDPDSARRPRDAGAFAIALADQLASLEHRTRLAEIEAAEARAAVIHERRARRLTLLLGIAVVVAVAVPLILMQIADRDRQRRQAVADQAVAAATGRARTLLEIARLAPADETQPWSAAVAAAHEARSVAADPDVPSESLTAATILADTIERERSEAADRAAIIARLEALHPHGRVEDPPATDQAYCDAFNHLGVDLSAAPDLGVTTLAPLHCVDELADALDELTLMRRRYSVPDADAWRVPHAIVSVLDADPTRAEIRAAFGAGDVTRLETLAATASADLPVRTLNLLARSLAESNRTIEAIRVFRIASTRYPGHYWTQHDLAALLELTSTPPRDEMARLLGMALASRPENAHAMIDLGRVLSLTGDRDNAIKLLERAAQLEPKNSRASLLLGSNYAAAGQSEDAHRELLRSAELGNVLAMVSLAERLTLTGEFDEALRWTILAAESPPSDATARRILVERLSRLHRPELALRVMRKLREHNPTSEDTLVATASIELMLGKLDEVQRELQEFASSHTDTLSPRFRSLQQSLARSLEQAALLEARSTTDLDSEPASLRGVLGVISHQLGRPEIAYDLFSGAIAESPDLLGEPTGVLAMTAVAAAASVAKSEGETPRGNQARSNAFSWAANFVDQIDTARRTALFEARVALEYLASLVAIEAFAELRQTRPDSEFDRRFDEVRAAAVAAAAKK